MACPVGSILAAHRESPSLDPGLARRGQDSAHRVIPGVPAGMRAQLRRLLRELRVAGVYGRQVGSQAAVVNERQREIGRAHEHAGEAGCGSDAFNHVERGGGLDHGVHQRADFADIGRLRVEAIALSGIAPPAFGLVPRERDRIGRSGGVLDHRDDDPRGAEVEIAGNQLELERRNAYENVDAECVEELNHTYCPSEPVRPVLAIDADEVKSCAAERLRCLGAREHRPSSVLCVTLEHRQRIDRERAAAVMRLGGRCRRVLRSTPRQGAAVHDEMRSPGSSRGGLGREPTEQLDRFSDALRQRCAHRPLGLHGLGQGQE